MPCPCQSHKSYEECCKPFHEGKERPKTALDLMRSRYSAYSLGLVRYIIDTTHPSSPLFQKRTRAQIEEDIRHFCESSQFTGLEIVEAGENAVTFIAHLEQGGSDASFKEKSRFAKQNGRWLYLSGTLSLH